MSRKRAKSRTRGRKRSTGANGRGGRARKTRADLERQLKACRRQIAHARERLAEAAMQQTATAEMLRLISNAPIQSVLDAVAEHAARLCDASNARIWRLQDDLVRLVATYGESSATMDGREGLPLNRDTATGRAACDRRTIHVHDIAVEDREFPLGSRVVKGQGWHTTLATPLLREGTPIGTILVRRREVRPFSDKQITLLETFAGQAAIAIENVRLFEAEKQRTLALGQSEYKLRRSEAYLAESQRLAHTGTAVFTEKEILYWSDETYRFFGFDPSQGIPSRDAVWQRVHPDDAGKRNEAIKRAVDERKSSTNEFRIIAPDGTVKHIKGINHPVFSSSGEFVEIIGTAIEVTEHKRAEERLHVQHTVAQILAEAATIEAATPRILLAIGECLGWDVGVLWRVDREIEALRCVEVWHKASIAVPEFKRASRESTFAVGLGLPGRVWSSREPIYIPDVVPDENFPRAPIAEREGLRAAFGFPILLGVEVLGVIEFFSREIRQPDQALLNVLATIGSQIGQFIERKQAEEALRRSEDRLTQAQRLSRTGNWVLDATTRRYLYWSEESYRIWGFDPVRGLPSRDDMWQRIHPDDRDKVCEEVQEALRQKRDFSSEFRIVLPDGTIKHLEATTYHTFSPFGALTEAVSTHVDVTERKRAEQALREREAKIRRLVDANIIGIFFWDFDGRILEANDAFLTIVGYDHEDLVAGRLWWTDLTPQEWRERDTQLLQEHKLTGTLKPFEKEYLRKDGSRVPVLIGVATFEEGGNQGVAFVIDLTERKRAEEALRRSEAHLAEAQRLSHTGAVAYDGKAILFASEETYHIWGFDPAKGLPSREAVFQRIHPDDRDWLTAEVRRAVDEKRRYLVAYRILLPDGTVKHLETIGQPVFSASGKLVEIFATQTDVTERKRAEEALRRSEAWLTQAQRLSRTGTWVMNGTTRRFLYWSDESYRIWELDPLQGLPSREDFWDRIHPDDREQVWGEVQEAMREQRDFFAEFRILLPDGTVKYVEANTRHEFSPLGELLEILCTTVDVTERKRAQNEHERLRQLESDLAHINRLSMMGELTASLAHEITQPIASARNNARAALNFLDKRPPELSDVREALDCVVGDADRAGNIIDRIRDQVNKAPPRKLHFDLNESIDEVLVLAASAISKSGVSVQTQLGEGLLPVHGDRVQLQQVVLNLVLNAVEAMSSVEEGPRELSISTAQSQAKGVLVATRDSGPGIDPANLERLFEAFYTTKPSGVGMGLAICRSIIAAHGGRLWAEANKPRGATFLFTLPGTGEGL